MRLIALPCGRHRNSRSHVSTASERTNFSVRPLAQIGMREVDELAVEPLARDLPDLEARMRQREAQQLAAGVAGRADDGRRIKRFGHELTGCTDAPSASEIDARCRPLVRPAVGRGPAVAGHLQAEVHHALGMFTLVGAMLLRNSIV